MVYDTLANREEKLKPKTMENPKQQAIERLRSANNVLVTVSNNPSVDQLAAAIALTLFLNKLNKHATTVFSGQIPSTIEFLQPEKTIEKNTDSLRDFIIALDKSKADKLRYKVEDKLVKIFITPYHTSIGEADLEFSHGDFNVDAVLALGVQKREELDQAITAHGRILHDATVITVNTQANTDIGAINWQDPNVSSLCELAYGIAESLQADAIDGQMATAFLTGIVAETERFSNAKTSSTAMAISSKLMTSGANQQLVATKLAPPPPPPKPPQDDSFRVPKGSVEANAAQHPKEKSIPAPNNGMIAPKPLSSAKPAELPKPVKDDGALSISHDDKATDSINQILNAEEEEDDVEQVHIDDEGTLKYASELAREHEQTAAKDTASQVTTGGAPAPAPLDQPPSIGNANNTPVDPLTTDVNPAGQPLLNHKLPPSSTTDEDEDVHDEPLAPGPGASLTDLEQSVHSPHLQADSSHVDRAREAVSNAVSTTPGPLQPFASLNAQHIDLDSPAPPVSPTPPAPAGPDVYTAGLQQDFADSQNSVADGLPVSIVPPASPVDQTASPNQASAPPLVPPPMMPPTPASAAGLTMPPNGPVVSPSQPATPPQDDNLPPPPAPTPPTGNPLFPQP